MDPFQIKNNIFQHVMCKKTYFWANIFWLMTRALSVRQLGRFTSSKSLHLLTLLSLALPLFTEFKKWPLERPLEFLEALHGWLRCRRRFFSQKNGPHIFGSPELVGTLPQALFFQEKRAPYFWKPLACGYVAAGAFFSETWPPYFWKPPAWGRAGS